MVSIMIAARRSDGYNDVGGVYNSAIAQDYWASRYFTPRKKRIIENCNFCSRLSIWQLGEIAFDIIEKIEREKEGKQ